MLSAAAIERLAINLGKIGLPPAQYFAVAGAVWGALMEETSSPREEASSANGGPPIAAPSHATPPPAKTRKARCRRTIRPAEGIARAKQALKENPGLGASGGSPAPLESSRTTAKRALAKPRQTGSNGSVAPTPRATAAIGDPETVDRRPLAAVSRLRGALSQGPKPCSHVEELAHKKGIGNAQLEAAKALMSIRAIRIEGVPDVCYALPHQAESAPTTPNRLASQSACPDWPCSTAPSIL